MKTISILNWTNFKSLIDSKNLSIQFHENYDKYTIFTFDGPIYYEYSLSKTDPRNDEQVDFEDNYKDYGNRPASQMFNLNEIPPYKVGTCDASYFKQKYKFSTTTSSGPVTYSIVFPYDVVVLGGKVIIKSNMQSESGIDKFKIEIAPGAIVGQITEAADQGVTHLTVDAACAADYVWRGDLIGLYDGTDSSVGRLVAKSSNSLTVEIPTERSFAIGTAVKVYTQIVPDYYCDSVGEEVQIGRKTHRAMVVPAGYPIVVTWENNSLVAKDVYFSLEWYV